MNALCAPANDVCDDALSECRQKALGAVRLAQVEIGRIADATDVPDWQDVDAADLLDTTVSLLLRETPS